MEDQTVKTQVATAKGNTKYIATFAISAVVIMILVGIIGFTFGTHKSKPSTYPPQQIQQKEVLTTIIASPTAAQPLTPSTPYYLVQGYYDWYVGCQQLMNTEDAFNNSNLSAKQECAYNKYNVFTDDLVQQLQKAVGSGPVLCSQNIPERVTFDNAVINNNTAHVVVHTLWGLPSTKSIIVGLQETNKLWRISSITCNK